VAEYQCKYKGRSYILIDTPGFEDTYRTNDEILEELLTYLSIQYSSGTQLSGVVYLHPISSLRIGGTARENLQMFRKLCGDGALKNVILATTFWDCIGREKGRNNENELTTNDEFWGTLVKKGSIVCRLKQNDPSSAFAILEKIEGHCVLRAQEEIVDEGKKIQETGAASFTRAAIEKSLENDFEREMKSARKALEERQREDNERARKQREEVKRQIQRQEEKRRRLEAERILQEEEEERERERERRRIEEELRRKVEERQREWERIAAERRAQEEQRQRKLESLRQALKEQKRRYYKAYVCTRGTLSNLFCDRCSDYIPRGSWYYRKLASDSKKKKKPRTLLFTNLPVPIDCCHCHDDNYNHCESCGAYCSEYDYDDGHPRMKFKYLKTRPMDDCILM